MQDAVLDEDKPRDSIPGYDELSRWDKEGEETRQRDEGLRNRVGRS